LVLQGFRGVDDLMRANSHCFAIDGLVDRI
jgi:hypothetical protein